VKQGDLFAQGSGVANATHYQRVRIANRGLKSAATGMASLRDLPLAEQPAVRSEIVLVAVGINPRARHDAKTKTPRVARVREAGCSFF